MEQSQQNHQQPPAITSSNQEPQGSHLKQAAHKSLGNFTEKLARNVLVAAAASTIAKLRNCEIVGALPPFKGEGGKEGISGVVNAFVVSLAKES